jgi:hypothetical protein
MPVHPRFVKLHGFEAYCKPTFFNVVLGAACRSGS